MQTKTITYKGKPASYLIAGAGKPVVLLHGFGETVSVWRRQIEALEALCQLIIPGIPGGGLSEFNAELTSLDDYAYLLKEILQAEGIKSCVLFGHSMGGYIALSFAARFPEMLLAMGLIHSSAFADNGDKIATRKKSIDFIRAHDAAEYFNTSIPGLFSEETILKEPSLPRELINSVSDLLPAALAQQQQAMIDRPDRTDMLRMFDKPVLFIIGQYDKAVPFEAAMKQCYLPAVSHVHILRHSGHMGMWEEREKTNAAMAGFLAAIEQ